MSETPGISTGIAAITLHNATGENHIIVVPGANDLLTLQDAETASDAIQAADMVILSLEIPITVLEAVVRIAHNAGVPVVLNPAPMKPLSDQFLRQIAVLIPNETESALLTTGNRNKVESAQWLAQSLAKGGLAVVTRGVQGITYAKQGEDSASLPSFPVAAVDSVGAGDCFTAALSVALAERRDTTDALRFAQAAAALAVTRVGAQDAMPSRSEVDRFLASQLK